MKDSLTVFQEPHGGDKTTEKPENHSTYQNPQNRPLGQKKDGDSRQPHLDGRGNIKKKAFV